MHKGGKHIFRKILSIKDFFGLTQTFSSYKDQNVSKQIKIQEVSKPKRKFSYVHIFNKQLDNYYNLYIIIYSSQQFIPLLLNVVLLSYRYLYYNNKDRFRREEWLGAH